MARREITQYFDDFDQTPMNDSEVNVVEFSVNGTDYTLDLSEENKTKFDEALAPYIRVARRLPRSPRRGATQPAARRNNPEYNRAVRVWAQSEGISVSDRGRIAADVIERFENRAK